jgi:hypothetical protein
MMTEYEIKFRGKRIDNGEWAYGAFVPDELEQTHGKMVIPSGVYFQTEPASSVISRFCAYSF